MQKELPRYMTYKQAMDCLNIKSYNTLYKYIKQGLRVVAINGTKRIDQLDADKFMEAHKV
ncbi:helix-turn-helix domain-containing protein [Lactiplantibacillus plantarum]|uniref:helix-turn-helix domain-containing protein n=1 Tax=Lactiplantibacillus plantarum TaxID=1590 RepID=UPI000F03570A|nr:helix-turn-helix domain-containing protein [Lactiplantibacillus plantarum]KAB1954413.1 helix-turn-helix domain-containing protein [Lactiplantibacillus plantarum]MDN7033800.1 helix-turn-helix domain-containing protein [Lactiplantibacillus plantarum]UZM81980.1 helix-turn-helix domain-containing protein [Lactiplantibacillus argentoratensis]